MKAGCLIVIFVLAKALALSGRDLPLSAWTLPAYLWQDIVVALIFAALDIALRRAWLAWTIYGGIVLFTALNVSLIRTLSSPLTWPMLGATRGALADSITHHLTLGNLIPMAIVLLAGAALPWWLGRAARAMGARTGSMEFGRRKLKLAATGSAAVALGGALVAFGPLASARLETAGLHRNALFALVTTAFPRITARPGEEDWRASPSESAPVEDLTRLRGAAAGRNVVFIVLESTGAQYLRSYGASEDPMPNLTRLAAQAIQFDNAYAVYPESIKGLFSVLCSRYPAMDTKPELYGNIRTPAVAAVLTKAGYRTGLFHSGRFSYLGMEAIVANRGFQTLEDAGMIGGNHQSSFGVDEAATVHRMLAWIDGLASGQPFFLTYLPTAGHHPYDTPKPGPFPDREERGRYLNALHYADEILWGFLDALRQRSLMQNTLFIVIGDHGEAFGQHEGNFGHTFFLYEENIRVPYLVFAPGLTGGPARIRRVASLMDVAPTVLDMLGLASPGEFQGHSLLEGRHRLALFYADYSLGLLGLRDGPWKFIYEMDSGRSKLFHLQRDNAELSNLTAQFPGPVALYRERLLRWGAAQKDLVFSGRGKLSLANGSR